MAEQPQQRGLRGLLSDPDKRDRLILALEGMTLNPNTALQQAAAQGLQERGQQRQQQAQAGRTADFLRARGRADLADAVEAGLPAADALRTALSPAQDDRTALIKNFEFAVSQGFEGSFQDYIAATKGGTTVNIAGQPQVGTIPQGFQLVGDGVESPFRMEPIPGGPADTEAKEIATKTLKTLELGETKKSIVDDQVDAALALMEKKGALDIIPEAGIIGGALGAMGLNQEAVDLKNTLLGIEGMVAFDTLQKMREASKTGGALGGVSEVEINMLGSALGALKQTTSKELLTKNLNTVKRIMGKIANDPIASQFIEGGGGGASNFAATPAFSVTGKF
jgi:hypothetical protein